MTPIEIKILAHLREHKTATRAELRKASTLTDTPYADYRWAEIGLLKGGLIDHHEEMRQTPHNGKCRWIGFKITEKGESNE